MPDEIGYATKASKEFWEQAHADALVERGELVMELSVATLSAEQRAEIERKLTRLDEAIQAFCQRTQTI